MTETAQAGAFGGVAATTRTVLAGTLIGAMSVVFCVSFASIIYTGPLADYLGPGIGLTLIGAVLLACTGALTLSYPGTICQPQDVTAILLSLVAAGLAATVEGDARPAFATIVAIIALSTFGTGATAYVLGRLQLSHLVRLVPYPVVSGFLVATGLLLAKSAFGTAVPGDISMAALPALWPQWLPWLALAVAVTVAMRRNVNDFVLPLVLIAGCTAFYLILPLAGIRLEQASEQGLLLGPFEQTRFLNDLDVGLVGLVDWRFVFLQTPMILTVIGLSVIGTLLNASAMEMAINREVDLDRDLMGVGKANLLSGLFGGMVGYHLLGETMLARRIGVRGAAAGFSVAAACAFCLVFGAELLAVLPRGLFAAIIWFLGFDLVLTALGNRGRPLPLRDLPVVVITPAIALVFGFLAAVVFGVLAACLIFVISYARVDVVRLSATGTSFRARIERTREEDLRLAELGKAVLIYRLSGFLFFGSANGLARRLRKQVEDAPTEILVLDLKRVVGLDLSTWAAFERLAAHCGKNDCKLVLTGLSPALRRQFEHWVTGAVERDLEIGGTLDEFLDDLEEKLLGAPLPDDASDPAPGTLHDPALQELIRQYGETVHLPAGTVAMREGEDADHLLVLSAGRLRVSVTGADGEDNTINRLRPGAVVGEVSYYAGVARTADVVAETECRAVRIDAKALKRIADECPARAVDLHRALAGVLARRLIVSTRSLRNTDI